MTSEQFASVTTVNISDSTKVSLVSKTVVDGDGVITLTGVAAGTSSVSVTYTDTVGVKHKRVFSITVRGEQPVPTEPSFSWQPSDGNISYTTTTPAYAYLTITNLPTDMTVEQFVSASTITVSNSKISQQGSPLVNNGTASIAFATSSSTTDGEVVVSASVTVDGQEYTSSKTFTCTDVSLQLTFTATAGSVAGGDNWSFSISGFPSTMTGEQISNAVTLSYNTLFANPVLTGVVDGTASFTAQANMLPAEATENVQIVVTLLPPDFTYQQIMSQFYAMTVTVPEISFFDSVNATATADCNGLGCGMVAINGIPADAVLADVLTVMVANNALTYNINDSSYEDPTTHETIRNVSVAFTIATSSVGTIPFSIAVVKNGTTYRHTRTITLTEPTYYSVDDAEMYTNSILLSNYATLEIEEVVETVNTATGTLSYTPQGETEPITWNVDSAIVTIVNGTRGLQLTMSNPSVSEMYTSGTATYSITIGNRTMTGTVTVGF